VTKPLDPEIKAMRALARALRPLDSRARRRAVTWLFAFDRNTTQDVVEARMRAAGEHSEQEN